MKYTDLCLPLVLLTGSWLPVGCDDASGSSDMAPNSQAVTDAAADSARADASVSPDTETPRADVTTPGPNQCGDGERQTGEACDDSPITCSDLSPAFADGDAPCLDDCSGWDTSVCTVDPQCGNGVRDPAEICDTAPPANQRECTSFGFEGGGKAICKTGCAGWDFDQCSGSLGAGLCGQPCKREGFGCLDGVCVAGLCRPLACRTACDAPDFCEFDADTCTFRGCHP